MSGPDLTRIMIRDVEEKLLDRIAKLEAFIEVLINSIPGHTREDLIHSAALLFLEVKKSEKEVEIAAGRERSFRAMEQAFANAKYLEGEGSIPYPNHPPETFVKEALDNAMAALYKDVREELEKK